METAIAVATLEEVTAKLAEHRATVAGLQREFEEATQEKGSLANLRSKFLVMASSGDAAATRHVEEIESKQLVTGRKSEGLQIRLQTAEAVVQTVQAEWQQLAIAAATAERVRKAEQVRTEVEKQACHIMALFRSVCRAEFDLCEYLKTHVVLGELNEVQKSEILFMVRQALRPPNTWNEKWIQSSCDLGSANLTTRNACAPDELKHLEISR